MGKKASSKKAAPQKAGTLSEQPNSTANLESLQAELLEFQIAEKRESRRWFVHAIRNVKLNEWVVGIAALIALLVGFTTGIFDATRQHLAAQSERLRIEKIDLENERSSLVSQIKAKEKELEELELRHAPFEEEAQAIQSLRQFDEKLIDVSFGTTAEFDGLRIVLTGKPKEFDWSMFGPLKTYPNEHLSDALREVNHLRSVKGIKISQLKVTKNCVELATEHQEIEDLALENCDLESHELLGLSALPVLKSLTLDSNRITTIENIPELPTVKYLDVSNNPLGDKSLDSLVESFPNLWYLNLAGTKVSDEGMRSLVKLSDIAFINVRNTRVTGQGGLTLIDCPSLRSVIIDENVVTDEQKKIFQREKPNHGGFLYDHDFGRWWYAFSDH